MKREVTVFGKVVFVDGQSLNQIQLNHSEILAMHILITFILLTCSDEHGEIFIHE